jgi:hypothetical protein
MAHASDRIRQRSKAQEFQLLQMQNTVDEQQKIINRFGDMQREAQEAFLSELKRREEQQKQDRQVENEGMQRQFLSELAKVKVRGVRRCV